MNQFKKKSLTSQSTMSYPKIMSFQKTFSNVNGQTNSSSKKIISDGNTGRMYLNHNGQVSRSDLNYHQLKKEFNFPFLNFDSPKIFTKYPLLFNDYNNKSKLRRRPAFLVKKFNWNTFLLLLIFLLLIFISIKLVFER